MLSEVCAEIRNYFTYRSDILIGDYAITEGVISPSVDFMDCEYFRIIGSRKNDGVHKIDDELIDEGTFHGSIWRMSPPQDFLDLVADIEKWQAINGGADSAAMSPFQSESFGGYSYSKATGNSTDGAYDNSWKAPFATRLKQYRRIRVL